MRTTPASELETARPPAGDLTASNGSIAPGFIRGAIRNSPWLVIAVSAHLVGLAALSVIYVKSHDQAKVETALAVRMVERPVVEEEALPPEIPALISPDAIPEPRDGTNDEGVPNLDDVIIPDAKAGRRGEITENVDPDKAPGEQNPDPEAPADLKSGATGGTSYGVGSHGHVGSGTPSAFVSRRLGGGGPGGGGLGEGGENGPGARRAGAPQRSPVLPALRWLKNHQSPDGHWDSDGFDAGCGSNRCDGAGEATYDVGLTGLSLLAYLGAGYTHQAGEFKDTVKNGIRYLRDVQDSEGCFGTRTSQHFLYNHACATLAMVEAYGMTGSRTLRGPAEQGIAFIVKARNPYGAWRYNVPPDGDNDTSVTGWMVMALKSAKLAGLDVESAGVKDAIGFVDKMTEPEFGRTGYQQRGGPPARTNDTMAKFPADKSESLTAVGLTVRLFGGHDLKSDPMIDKGADLLARSLPRWDVDKGTIDFYYWYYGSLAMFQVGGDRWKKWNEAMKSSLIEHQRLEKDRCEYGSWDPVDPWSPEGGRVYATAINCLTMEVYYRYPVLGVRSDAK